MTSASESRTLSTESLEDPLAEKVSISISGAGIEKSTSGWLKIRRWSQPERTKKAGKWLAICWGAALFSIFIPLLHFVLVPAFAIAGPFVAGWLYSQESTILGGEGSCPNCGKTMKFVKKQEMWPVRDVCGDCYQRVSAEKSG